MIRAVPRALAVGLTLGLAGGVSACNSSGPAASSSSASGRVPVAVAENFWGSLAAQIGGSRAAVRSIIVNPAIDPHTYQPSAPDARALAGARLVILNGLGYDNWAAQFLQASPAQGRIALNVGDLLGLASGANPHRWYYPDDVDRVAARIAADYERLDPSHAAYFAHREQAFLSGELSRYNALRREIRARYAGVRIGYSESIFQGLGEDLRLRLSTPYSFAKAIAEGTDVTAADKRTVDAQARERQIKVWVFNSQNVTPDVQRVNELAKAAGIPIVTVTETLTPPTNSFQQWQVAELEALMRALHLGTER